MKTVRSVQLPVQIKNGSSTGRKHSYVFIGPLREDTAQVVIVEGGVDVLAVWDRAKLNGQTPPTVICTGGVGVLLCFGNEEVRKILIDAQQVTFYAENELSSEKQAQTDAWRARQIGRVAEIRGYRPTKSGHIPTRGLQRYRGLASARTAGEAPATALAGDGAVGCPRVRLGSGLEECCRSAYFSSLCSSKKPTN